uniref:Uncharacterized membrane protein YckC, RDD family n=1 Tax=Candidatus Kentrum sp. FW TaxID=2126338 RepID=A0A450SRQ0_9GAMM|nr:MAG: Uncharacterized membrane protein YckC, RDD family [Candidatus Kentron sp. FW]
MSNEKTSIEAFGATYEYAGFWIRSGAAVIDTIILLLITGPIVTAIYGAEYWEGEYIIAGFWDFIITWILPVVAIVFLWNWKQATPGKMALKVLIVDEKTGNSPTMKQWIIRYLGYYLSLIPLGFGYFWVAWDSKKQGWHDKLAGTVVIRPKNKGVESVRFERTKT